MTADAGTDRRVLCVVPKAPVPTDSGSRQRIAHLLASMARIGSLDVIVGGDEPPAVAEPLLAIPGIEAVHVSPPLPRTAHPRRAMIRHRQLSLAAAVVDPAPVRVAAQRFVAGRVAATGRYDLVLYSRVGSFWLHRDLAAGAPTILDVDDVAFLVEARRLAAARRAPDRLSVPGLRRTARWWLASRRSRRFETAQVARADLPLLCSAHDVRASGFGGALVVPNGYERPSVPLGRAEVGDPPTLLFCGRLTYEPNEDAAVWFATEVLPPLRERRADARLVLVGRAGPAVDALADRPGVEVRGHVVDLGPELARADVVLAPLRHGGGTRIKILEGFAHRIPVVATTVGAEGLDVVDGRELLIADDPEALAAACDRVLSDPALRAGLVDRAAARFATSYDWAVIERDLAVAAADLVSSHRSRP